MSPELHHLAHAYALDALDADERAAFEAHYHDCDVCSGDVTADREVAAMLAEAVAVAPAPDLKAAVMGEITKTRQLPPLVPERTDELAARRAARRRQVGWVAGIAALLIAAIGVTSQFGDSRDDVADVVAAPDAIVTSLEGSGDGTLRVVWSAERDEVAVFGSDLANPGADRAYALWFLHGDGSVAPAGLFTPSDGGEVRTVLDVADDSTTGWGVTIEPATGSPQPTSDVIFVGTL